MRNGSIRGEEKDNRRELRGSIYKLGEEKKQQKLKGHLSRKGGWRVKVKRDLLVQRFRCRVVFTFVALSRLQIALLFNRLVIYFVQLNCQSNIFQDQPQVTKFCPFFPFLLWVSDSDCYGKISVEWRHV